MRAFATEFPIKPQSSAAFVAHLIQWLRGTRYSEVLNCVENEIEPDNFFAQAPSGEALRIRELNTGKKISAVGFRHDYPDGDGRNWRTEAVMLCNDSEQHSVRLRTQCQAKTLGAKLDNPRKPYLIKALLSDGWGGDDGLLAVTDSPLWSTPQHLHLVEKVLTGDATKDLPVVFISAKGNHSWDLSKDEIERLAYRLGGVAHVIVEPDRQFSFDLKHLTNGQNVYGGYIGIYAPTIGLIGRYFVGWDLPTTEALIERIEGAVIALRTRMPARGWDWSELQEASLRSRRSAVGNELEFKELEAIYLEEIEGLKEQISEQRFQIDEQNTLISENERILTELDDEPLRSLQARVGTQLYSGEIADRLRLAAKVAIQNSDRAGIDDHTAHVLNVFAEDMERSRQGQSFVEQLKSSMSSNDNLINALIPFLENHGFTKKSENKHIRLEPAKDLSGIGSITISKTPSDFRAHKNMRSQVFKILGLRSLDF